MKRSDLYHALARRYFKAMWYRQAKRILSTPALAPGALDLTVLSMVHRKDLLGYLVAIKSLHRFLPAQRIVVVADPSLQASQLDRLKAHVPFVQVVPAASFRHPDLPVGGTWERLAAISHFRQQGFVVQLDADTLTRSDIEEVRDCVLRNVSFVLGTEDNQSIIAADASAAIARRKLLWSGHVQFHCEAALRELAPLGLNRYVRGCSGFSGFSKNLGASDKLLDLSRLMAKQLEHRWSDWGTEQFASNVLIANDEQAVVLPHPKYCDPSQMRQNTVFVHFIGYLRYQSDLYARQVSRLLADYKSAAGRQPV